jgi:methyl-accepting chemotaxis protein
MEEKKEQKKFKRYSWRVIKWDVNIRYTLMFACLVILLFLLGGVITYLTIWENLRILPAMQPEHFLIIQKKILHLLTFEFLLGILSLLVLAVVFQFRVLHRVFGPLYRLEKALRNAASGKLPKAPIIFRGKDANNGMAEAFNLLVSAIKSGTKFK